MIENIDIVKPGALFVLGPKETVGSGIHLLFPHWEGGNVMITDIRDARLFTGASTNSTGTVTLVEFLFEDRIYNEGIMDFIKRAKHIT